MPILLLHITRILAVQYFWNVLVTTTAISTLGVTQPIMPIHQLLVAKLLLYVMRDYPSSWLLNATHRLDIIQVLFLFLFLFLFKFCSILPTIHSFWQIKQGGSISFNGDSNHWKNFFFSIWWGVQRCDDTEYVNNFTSKK